VPTSDFPLGAFLQGYRLPTEKIVEFSSDQELALQAAEDHVAGRGSRQQCLSIHGLAGTGKTTVLAEIARRYPAALMCTPTGKAAAVLRTKTRRHVSTIHRLIYNFVGSEEDPDWSYGDYKVMRPKFEPIGQRYDGKLVLLDEDSMVGTKLAKDLLDIKARFITSGDPGQLPPVRDERYFEKADVTLTEIHRQALESPIIRQAHAIRETGRYQADTPDFRVEARALDEDFRNVEMALCWKNSTRIALNRRRREAFGYSNQIMYAGEPLMVLRNCYDYGIWNGEIYELAADRGPGETEFKIRVEGRTVTIDCGLIEGIDPAFEQFLFDRDTVPFAMAYAATIHKAQGSQWKSIMVVDEPGLDRYYDRRMVLYTGVTRAEQSVIMVRRR